MLVLDIPRRSPRNFAYIDVPVYHRLHLSLTESVPAYACLLASSNAPHHPELVISTFDFSRWDRIWRLNLELRDRPGLLHDVCDTLRQNGANILAAESSMMQEQNVYHIEVIIEMEDETRMHILGWTIQARLTNEHVLHTDGNPRFRIRRLYNLSRAKREYDRQRMLHVGFAPLVEKLYVKAPGSHSQQSDKHALKSGPKMFRLRLPASIRDTLKLQILELVGDRHDEGFYLRLSDTKDRFLRVLFFKASDPVLHARMAYKDRRGAAADVTHALKEAGFNILAAYMGPAEGEDRSRCEVIARCERLRGKTISELKDQLETSLQTSSRAVDLEIVVSYPRDYANRWDSKELEPLLPTAKTQTPRENPSWIPELKTTLDSHYSALALDVVNGKITPEGDDRQRWSWIQGLQRQYEDLVPRRGGHIGRSLFISCHLQGDQLGIAKRHADVKGFVVLTGESLIREPNITAGLLTKMGLCTHYLGLWSMDGAQRFGEEYWPSPWLFWEFGVAEALGLVWRLLISKHISKLAWGKVAPHVQNLVFDHDFETKLDEILDVLSELPGRRPHSQ